MKYTTINFILIIIIFVTGSCASIINSKKTQITIHTTEPTQIAIDTDTLEKISEEHRLTVYRSKEPLPLTVIGKDKSKSHEIKSHTTMPYFMNLFGGPILWAGLYIDDENGSRYGYPTNIYINPHQDKYYSQNPKYLYDHAIKINPLKIVGAVNPSIELSYEKVLNSRYSAQLSAGYLLPNPLNKYSDARKNTVGYTVSLEGRKYLSESAPLGSYIAVNVHFKKNKYNSFAEFNPYSHSPVGFEIEHSYYDDIIIDKKTISSNFKIGYQTHIKRFIIDFYGGIGLKYKDVKHLDRRNIHDHYVIGHHVTIPDYTNKLGRETTVSIPLNLKVGWLFNL